MKEQIENQKRKSNKGRNLTADYIPYQVAMERGQTLLMDPKKTRIGFLIILGVNVGLRISDLLSRKHSDFIGLNPGDSIRVLERKSQKWRIVTLNRKVIDAYRILLTMIGQPDPEEEIFRSQKQTTYHIASINEILKTEFRGVAPQISSHSLRKSFGRHVYELNGRNEDALVYLSEIFNHKSQAVTRRYLGIRQEEIGNIYLNL